MYPDTVLGFADLPENYRYGDDGWRPEVAEQEGPLAPALATAGLPVLPATGVDMKEYLQDIEREWIAQALNLHAGVVSKAALHLGLRRTTLIEKMRKLGIQS